MKRLFLLFAACAALMLVVSPAATYAQHEDPDMEWEMDGPLYDRMGGEEIVSGIVEEFVSMVIEDDKLKSHFEGVDQEKMKEMLVAQITYASGGEIEYEGQTFLESLAGMGITGESLESVTEHMTASMEANDAWPEDVDELLVVLELIEGEHELVRIEEKQDSVSVRYETDTGTSIPAQKE